MNALDLDPGNVGTFGVHQAHAAGRRSAGRRVALWALRAYQAAASGRASPCRFYPSCSAYAIEAVERHGAPAGLWLAARPLAPRRPFGGHGGDLVPLETRRDRRRKA